MSYQVSASTPMQCVKQTIAWSGPAGPKRIEMWVEGTNYFAETIAANVTGTLGTVDWTCGTWSAFASSAISARA